MSICIKAISTEVPVGEIVFFRSAFALIPLVIFLWIRGEFPHGLSTKRPLGHLLRSSLGAAAMFASFASIARLPLAEATLLSYLSPTFTSIAGVLLLSERVTVWRVGGVVLGLAGVLILVWPEMGNTSFSGDRLWGYVFGLLMGVLTAFALIMVRSLSRTESPGAIAFYFVIASMLGGIATIPFGWMAPDMYQLIMLVLAGLFGGFAQLFDRLAGLDVDLIILPAAFTQQTGRDHWEVLCRARAIEFQCYFVACGQCGSYRAPNGEERVMFGHSMVVDPWGRVIATSDREIGVINAVLDRAVVDKVRGMIPMAEHRRDLWSMSVVSTSVDRS